MTNLEISILIYIVGAILSYGRANASFFEFENNEIILKIAVIGIAIISWIGFFVGITIWIGNKEKHFLKFKK